MQDSLNPTLRIRALCKLALLYTSVEDLSQAGSKVKEVVSFISSGNLEQDRELATLVDMTVFMVEQAQTIVGRIAELAQPAPYVGIDCNGERPLTKEMVNKWYKMIDQGYVILDFRKTTAHLNTSEDAIELNEHESTIIDMLMREGAPISVRRFLNSVWDEEDVQPTVVKATINRIRKKLGSSFDNPSKVIRTCESGYYWNQSYLWKIIKYNGHLSKDDVLD